MRCDADVTYSALNKSVVFIKLADVLTMMIRSDVKFLVGSILESH